MLLWIFVWILISAYVVLTVAAIFTLIDYFLASNLYRIECGYDCLTSTTVLAHSEAQALRKLRKAYPGCHIYSIRRIDI